MMMPVSIGMFVNESNIAPNATRVPATHIVLATTVVMAMAIPAILPNRCSMKSATVMSFSLRKRRAKKRPTRTNASAPPQGSAMTPSMPSSKAAPAPPSIIAPPNQVASTVIDRIGRDSPRPATIKSAIDLDFFDA